MVKRQFMLNLFLCPYLHLYDYNEIGSLKQTLLYLYVFGSLYYYSNKDNDFSTAIVNSILVYKSDKEERRSNKC